MLRNSQYEMQSPIERFLTPQPPWPPRPMAELRTSHQGSNGASLQGLIGTMSRTIRQGKLNSCYIAVQLVGKWADIVDIAISSYVLQFLLRTDSKCLLDHDTTAKPYLSVHFQLHTSNELTMLLRIRQSYFKRWQKLFIFTRQHWRRCLLFVS